MAEMGNLADAVNDILTTHNGPASEEPDRELRRQWRYAHQCDGREPTPGELEQYRQELTEQARQYRERTIAHRLERFVAAVGERYRGVTLANYQIEHPGQQEVIDALNAYCEHGRENVLAGHGIVLFGASGTGKDHLVIALAIGAIRAGFDVLATSGPNLASGLRDLIDSGESEEQFFGGYTSANVLLLSDPLPPGGSLTNFQAEGLYRIVDERYRRRKATWVTVNVASGQEADERLGSAVVDRLRDGALCLRCDWPSFRRSWTPEASE